MKRHLPILLLLVLLGVGAVAVCKYWHVLHPAGEPSEVYRQYYKTPGIRAAYIRQMPINDTLRLDMTLFEAEDSAAFVGLLRAMGGREEFIQDMTKLKSMFEKTDNGYDTRHSGRCPRGHPTDPPDVDPNNNEVVSFFPVRMCIAIFHTHTQQEIQTVLDKSFFNEIDIDKQ